MIDFYLLGWWDGFSLEYEDFLCEEKLMEIARIVIFVWFFKAFEHFYRSWIYTENFTHFQSFQQIKTIDWKQQKVSINFR